MNRQRAGFTLIEILIFIAIAMGVIAVLGSFVGNITSFKGYFDEALVVEEEIRIALAFMVKEIRSAAQSNVGSYAIESANPTALAFYSDIDGDGLFERVRYFLDGRTLKKGVIRPTGNPLTYNPANEVVSEAVHDVVLGYDIFNYHGSGFTGVEAPLPTPVNIPDVRLVEITLTADQTTGSPGSAAITSAAKVTIRNLRDH